MLVAVYSNSNAVAATRDADKLQVRILAWHDADALAITQPLQNSARRAHEGRGKAGVRPESPSRVARFSRVARLS